MIQLRSEAKLKLLSQFLPPLIKTLPQVVISWILGVTLASSAGAKETPQELQELMISEHLGRRIQSENLVFRDEKNRPVRFAQYFASRKPILLTLVYYNCPMLCNLVLNGVVDAIKPIDFQLGQQFEMITVSINPLETSELAQKKKLNYLNSYQSNHPRLQSERDRTSAEAGWHFLTGEESQIQSLASQVGFKYVFDPKENQYRHAAAIYILTPDGKISRYLYGTHFKSQNLRLALLEASQGSIAQSTVDRVLLFCFHFDPSKNSYTLKVWRVIQLVLFGQVLALGAILAYLWKKEKIRTTSA